MPAWIQSPKNRATNDRKAGFRSRDGVHCAGFSSNVRVAINQVQDPYLSRFYIRLKRKKTHQVAIVATARKMLVSIYYTLTRKEMYNPPTST